MTVTAPNTAVTWTVGSTQTISWANNLGTSATVILELTRDGGATREVIASAAPNTSVTGGTDSWVVSGPATTAARVRATWTASSTVTDQSNTNFTIQ